MTSKRNIEYAYIIEALYTSFFIRNLLKIRLLEFLRKIAILELEFLTSFLTNSKFDQFLRDFEIFI